MVIPSRFRHVAVLYLVTVAALALLGTTGMGRLFELAAVILTLPTGALYFLTPFVRFFVGSEPWWLGPGTLLGFAVVNAFVLRFLLRFTTADQPPREVDNRLVQELLAVGVAVTPVVQRGGRIHTDPYRPRERRSMLLRDLPVPAEELFDTYRGRWTQAGHQVSEGAEGARDLRADDGQGYTLQLQEASPDVILQVLSPAVRRRGLVPGVLTAVVPQGVLCLPAIGLLLAADNAGDPILYGLYPLFGGLLVVGPAGVVVGLVLLLSERGESFGKGLLIASVPGPALALAYLSTALF